MLGPQGLARSARAEEEEVILSRNEDSRYECHSESHYGDSISVMQSVSVPIRQISNALERARLAL